MIIQTGDVTLNDRWQIIKYLQYYTVQDVIQVAVRCNRNSYNISQLIMLFTHTRRYINNSWANVSFNYDYTAGEMSFRIFFCYYVVNYCDENIIKVGTFSFQCKIYPQTILNSYGSNRVPQKENSVKQFGLIFGNSKQ